MFFLSGCSSTRYVPEGEYLLTQTTVKRDNIAVLDFLRSEENKQRRRNFSTSHLSRSDFVPLQRQVANSRFFGVPLRLWMYNSVDIEKNNWWARTMRKTGQPPVIFDSVYADLSVRQMQQFLVNNGYFNSTVHYDVETLKRRQRVSITFDVNLEQGYHYRDVNVDVKDDSLKPLFENWSVYTLIKSGEPYDVEVLEAERLRVTRYLQNSGYYSFNRDNITFSVDSSLNAFLMDVTMVVAPPSNGNHHEKYTFSEIYIFPDERPGQTGTRFDTTTYSLPRFRKDTAPLNYHFVHSRPLQIKPRTVVSKLAIQPGDPYSLVAVDRTYENLLDLRILRTGNIAIQPQPIDSNHPQYVLNTTIETRQSSENVWGNELEITTSSTSGMTGTVINTSLQNRNLFGGAEILSLRLRGQLEVQYLLDKAARERDGGSQFIDNYDFGISANLDIPRFISPFDLRQTNVHRPRTLINLSYSYRYRLDYYNRRLTNLAFGYSWRGSRVTHTLFPLDINFINISLDDQFQVKIDTLSQNNRRLEYQYKDHFIFAARYGFSFSGQQGNRPINFNAFRFSLETSGNALNALSQALGSPKNSDGMYQFFGLGYAQYLRSDADFRRYWFLTDHQVLVTRLMGGVGIAYGNSEVLPYEKGFFAGGTNNIRAWPMNFLGPGSYSNPPDKPNIERIGDIVLVGNVEYRFPISGAFKGALFTDFGNIWLGKENEIFPDGKFEWKNVANDLAVGGGFGFRWDLSFLVIRLDAATPLRNPAKPNGEKWVIRQIQPKKFVLNFGIGYPF